MLQSQLFCKTFKKAPKTAEVISHKLLVKGDFISQLASGIYNFLPLGCRVQKKIEKIIREEMDAIGGQEVLLAALQPKELWQKTDRWEHMDPPLFKIKDRHKKEFALGSTHEEAITDLVKTRIQSYKDLPLALYQIQNKFRNEMRSTGGLLRTREFIMKDLYSFHTDQRDLDRFFNKVLRAYDEIYKRCGLKVIKSEASGGVFTKEENYEFQVLAEIGEDRIIYCPKCNWAANLEVSKVKKECPECRGRLVKKNSIEVGHIFKLGTKYSKALDLYFRDKKGEKKPVVMGCYGIGIGRLMATIVEVNHDKKGIIWPKTVAPLDIHLIPIFLGKENIDKKIKKISEKLYINFTSKTGQKEKIEVLYDDREGISAGEKLVEADLIGIPCRIVISNKTLEKNSVEIKERAKNKIRLIKTENLSQFLISNF